MSTKLFSPSLDMRSEPPNSMAKVLHVGTGNALVSFRGKSYTARMAGSFAVGEDAYFIEHPRGVYWITAKQGSWYANPLENWVKGKRPAQTALEYLLRKCKKWSPFIIGEDENGNPTLNRKDLGPTVGFEGYGTEAGFAALDQNGDGKISQAEWEAAGGSAATFAALDRNGDGYIDRDEWTRGGFQPGGANNFGGAGTNPLDDFGGFGEELLAEEVPDVPSGWAGQSASNVVFMMAGPSQSWRANPYFSHVVGGVPATLQHTGDFDYWNPPYSKTVSLANPSAGSGFIQVLNAESIGWPGGAGGTTRPKALIITPSGNTLDIWFANDHSDWVQDGVNLAPTIDTYMGLILAQPSLLFAFYQGKKWGWNLSPAYHLNKHVHSTFSEWQETGHDGDPAGAHQHTLITRVTAVWTHLRLAL